MKKTTLLAGLILLVTTQFALAAGKVVVFDFDTAVFNTEYAKKSFKALQTDTDFAQWVAKEESLLSEVQTLNKQKEANELTWSAEQSGEYRRKVNLLQEERQFNIKKLKEAQAVWQNKMRDEMQVNVEKILQQIIETEGVEIVLARQAAMYVAPSVDITPKVVEALNKIKK